MQSYRGKDSDPPRVQSILGLVSFSTNDPLDDFCHSCAVWPISKLNFLKIKIYFQKFDIDLVEVF